MPLGRAKNKKNHPRDNKEKLTERSRGIATTIKGEGGKKPPSPQRPHVIGIIIQCVGKADFIGMLGNIELSPHHERDRKP